MKGKLYGVGVGPGDSGLLTLKAKEILEKADVIAVPVKAADEDSRALAIIRPVIDVQGKEIMPVVFAMEHSLVKREKCRKEAAKQIKAKLDQGKNTAMIVLGDISVYSTYHQVYQYIRDEGYDTEIIPGISAFSDGAARAQISLVEGNENMVVLSSLKGPETLKEALAFGDNLVVMKAGSSMNYIDKLLEAEGLKENTVVLSNVGMDGEYVGAPKKDTAYGYFTTLIIKKGGL